MLEIERRQAVNSDLTQTRDLVLHSVLTFDPAGLHHVVTKVKNRLPSKGSESHYLILCVNDVIPIFSNPSNRTGKDGE